MSGRLTSAVAVVLALLWVGLPFVPSEHVNLAWTHMAAVSVLVGLAAVRAASLSRVALGVPWFATALACVSLMVAVESQPERFPIDPRWWSAHTGWAHALTFLAALVLVPARDGVDDVKEHRFEPALQPARRLRHLLVVLLLALVLAQALAMLPQVRAGERPVGSLGNPNILGATLAAAGLAMAAFSRWHVLALVPLSGVLVLMLSTGSRGALAATLGVLLLLGLRRGPRQVLGVLAAIAVVLVVVPNPLTERVLALRDDHHFSRWFFWEVAARNIAENPLGIGPGMNRFVFPPLALDPEYPWLLHQRHAVGLTHNALLTLTLEWGWAAGAAALGLLGWCLARLWPRGAADALGQGATLGACVLLAEAQVDGVEQNPLAFSLLLFLGGAALARLPGKARGLPVPGRALAALLLVAALALGVQSVRRMQRDQPVGAAVEAVAAYVLAGEDAPDEEALRLDAELAVTAAENAAPDSPEPHLQRFLLLEEKLKRGLDAQPRPDDLLAGWSSEGADALARARDRDPADPWLARCAARSAIRLYRRVGRSPDLLEAYFGAMAELLERDPLDVAARWEVAQEAQRAGRMDLMEVHCKALLALEPDDALAWYALGVMRDLAGDEQGALTALQRSVEAIYNCRIKRAIENPASQAYYDRILERLKLEAVRKAQATLRRRVYG
jgi:tetratricopeptide (TPR) repeat protein